MEETTAINNNQLSIVTLTSPQLPTLPFDVIPEILCRLPVKLLLQLRCVCKSWNSLISGSSFIKKHLHLSTTRHLHFLSYTHDSFKYILKSYPLNSVFTNITTSFTQFEYSRNIVPGKYPWSDFNHILGFCNCNGILCIVDCSKGLVTLWNPYIRNFKELPLYKEPKPLSHYRMTFGFGYDSFMDKYKVVVINLTYHVDHTVDKIEVRVHTLGTNLWRSVKEYPFKGTAPIPDFEGLGKFVSGTINWLFIKELCWTFHPFIVSFDLAKECFQKISPPSIEGVDVCDLSSLDVLRDCLCVTSGDDIWIMKEYGNKESWTKLFTIPYMRGPTNSHVRAKAVYLFEDDQLLLKFKGDFELTLILYDSKSGTLKSTSFSQVPEVCIESLISPCSLC